MASKQNMVSTDTALCILCFTTISLKQSIFLWHKMSCYNLQGKCVSEGSVSRIYSDKIHNILLTIPEWMPLINESVCMDMEPCLIHLPQLSFFTLSRGRVRRTVQLIVKNLMGINKLFLTFIYVTKLKQYRCMRLKCFLLFLSLCLCMCLGGRSYLIVKVKVIQSQGHVTVNLPKYTSFDCILSIFILPLDEKFSFVSNDFETGITLLSLTHYSHLCHLLCCVSSLFSFVFFHLVTRASKLNSFDIF